MKTPQDLNQTESSVWPFAFVNGQRTEQSQKLLESKHTKTKEVFHSSEYEEALFEM